MHDKSYGDIIYIAETKVLTLHLYVRIIADSWQAIVVVYLGEYLWMESAKCVKYCADKYEF